MTLVADRLKFTQLKPEMLIDPLRQQIADLEQRLYAHYREMAAWEAIEPAKVRARAIDSRWEATAKQQKTEQLGAHAFQIELIEQSLAQASAELAHWEALAEARKEKEMNTTHGLDS